MLEKDPHVKHNRNGDVEKALDKSTVLLEWCTTHKVIHCGVGPFSAAKICQAGVSSLSMVRWLVRTTPDVQGSIEEVICDIGDIGPHGCCVLGSRLYEKSCPATKWTEIIGLLPPRNAAKGHTDDIWLMMPFGCKGTKHPAGERPS